VDATIKHDLAAPAYVGMGEQVQHMSGHLNQKCCRARGIYRAVARLGTPQRCAWYNAHSRGSKSVAALPLVGPNALARVLTDTPE
jgi:hypothetical protein